MVLCAVMWSRDHGLGLETVSRPKNCGLGLGLGLGTLGLGLGLGLGTPGLGLGLGLATPGLGLGLGLPNSRSWSRSRSWSLLVLVSVSNLWSRLSVLIWLSSQPLCKSTHLTFSIHTPLNQQIRLKYILA